NRQARKLLRFLERGGRLFAGWPLLPAYVYAQGQTVALPVGSRKASRNSRGAKDRDVLAFQSPWPLSSGGGLPPGRGRRKRRLVLASMGPVESCRSQTRCQIPC